jgi:UDP-4-amino-4,6-dideoxy-N-acetyl-beta-L-altrosamine transaminase
MLRYSRQTISKKDIEGVTSVLQSDFLTQGPKVPEFEKKIIKYTSARYCAAVNSASSALYIACKVLKLKNNDIIWTVTNSFVASANCILLSGHKIDFVDIDNETWNISLDKLEKKLIKTKKNKKLPKAVIIVHLGGLPVDPKKIKLLSKKYKFKIIEDASHSIGSEYYGEKVGSCKWSDMCVFSFHPVKIITTGEGGCVMTNNKIYYERMKLIRNNGITNETKNFKHKKIGPWYYEQQDIGFNFRMNDMQAALGISQLKRINLFVRLRNKIADIYKKELKELPLNFQRIDKYYLSSYHLFIIKIKNKIIYKSFFEYLRKNKIFTNLHYLPIHMHPFYQNLGYKKNDFPNSENYSSQALSIPIYPNLKYKDQFKVINLIKNFFKKNNK